MFSYDGKSYTGEPEYVAGVMCAYTARDESLWLDNIDKLEKYRIGTCRLLGKSWNDISYMKDKEDLIDYIKFITFITEQDEEDVDFPTKKFICTISYKVLEQGGFERDLSFFEVYQFDTPSFLKGVEDATDYLNISIIKSTVLEVRNLN